MVYDGEERARCKQLPLKVLSEESSDEESGNICVHRPVWRSSSESHYY